MIQRFVGRLSDWKNELEAGMSGVGGTAGVPGWAPVLRLLATSRLKLPRDSNCNLGHYDAGGGSRHPPHKRTISGQPNHVRFLR